jgi:hypothetical protein
VVGIEPEYPAGAELVRTCDEDGGNDRLPPDEEAANHLDLLLVTVARPPGGSFPRHPCTVQQEGAKG